MAKATETGEYKHRYLLLPCVREPQGDNGEEAETWPDPPAVDRYYYAAHDSFSTGEQIVQGLAQSVGTRKAKIKGKTLPILSGDRMKDVVTGELYRVAGILRDFAETILTLDRAQLQTVAR